MKKFENYNLSASAYECLEEAKQQAIKLESDLVTVHHFFLAFLLKDKSLLVSFLKKKLPIDDCISYVKKLSNEQSDCPPEGLAYEERFDPLLDFANRNALNAKSEEIQPSHLFFSLVKIMPDYESFFEGYDVKYSQLQEIALREHRKKFVKSLQNLKVPENNKEKAESSLSINELSKKPYESQVKKNLPNLYSYGRDITELAFLEKLDPIVGRDKEVERLSLVLSRRKKHNAILVGEPGVGKTAIVEGLAQRILEEKVPESLVGKSVFALDLAQLVAGTKYRGQFEERAKLILEELQKTDKVIVFIDEIHSIVGAGGAEGTMDASNILKPALARGEIQCIGTTTFDEYRRYIEKDGALVRRFQIINIDEPNLEDSVKMLKGLIKEYEKFYNIKYPEEILYEAVNLSSRYIYDRFLPDKAIDLIDELGARVHSKSLGEFPRSIKKIDQEIEQYSKEKLEASKNCYFEEAAKWRDKENQLRKKRLEIITQWRTSSKKPAITKDLLYESVASMTKIPINVVSSDEMKKIARMKKILKKSIIGQDEAVNKITMCLQRSRLDLKNPNKPIGSFVFFGSTGVGKTLLAKTIAKEFFGTENALIRVDMSEYMDKFSSSRLLGAPPGYVGHDDGGELSKKVRLRPYSVILFDELEKADNQILDMLLQILDDGYATDSQGRKVNFRNTIIILTSNLGANEAFKESLGFSPDSLPSYEDIKHRTLVKAENFFRAEFLNRLDDLIVFNSLSKNDLKKIADIEIKKLTDRLEKKEIKVHLSSPVKDFIVNKAYQPKYGSRALLRTIEVELENNLVNLFIDGKLSQEGQVKISVKNGNLDFSVLEKELLDV